MDTNKHRKQARLDFAAGFSGRWRPGWVQGGESVYWMGGKQWAKRNGQKSTEEAVWQTAPCFSPAQQERSSLPHTLIYFCQAASIKLCLLQIEFLYLEELTLLSHPVWDKLKTDTETYRDLFPPPCCRQTPTSKLFYPQTCSVKYWFPYLGISQKR